MYSAHVTCSNNNNPPFRCYFGSGTGRAWEPGQQQFQRCLLYTIPPLALWYLLCAIPCFSVWYPFFLMKTPPRRSVYPPPSGRHAMRCLYVIGRDSWVWEMSSHALASMHSSHGVGEYSVTAVWPLAGGLSRRRPHEIIVVAVVVVRSVPVSLVRLLSLNAEQFPSNGVAASCCAHYR